MMILILAMLLIKDLKVQISQQRFSLEQMKNLGQIPPIQLIN